MHLLGVSVQRSEQTRKDTRSLAHGGGPTARGPLV